MPKGGRKGTRAIIVGEVHGLKMRLARLRDMWKRMGTSTVNENGEWRARHFDEYPENDIALLKSAHAELTMAMLHLDEIRGEIRDRIAAIQAQS